MTAIAAVVIVLGALGGCQGRATSAAAPAAPARDVAVVPVRVEPAVTLGALPRVFRPSAMLSWADDDALQAFLTLPGPLGTVRVTLEPLLAESRSLDEYRTALARGARSLKAFHDRGATIVVTVARMPRWLAARADEAPAGPHGFTIREASPPRDFREFERLAYETARALSVDLGLSPFYEFWNEPNSRSFWRGSRAEFLRTYEAFATGVRRADPKARVGGPAVGAWNDPREGEGPGPLLEHFIRHVGRARVPLDFVSWHNFGASPEEGWEGVEEVRRWLAAAGLPATTTQIVDEWNRWATFPEWLDPARDGALGAAHVVAAVHAMDRAGVGLQSIAAVQDFSAAPSGEAFVGDFGLLTRAPLIPKASFHAVALLARLDETRVRVAVPSDAADAGGIGVVATRRGDRVVIVAHRLAGDPLGAVVRSLRRAGYRRAADLGVPPDALERYLRGEAPLPASVTPAARAALERARAMARTAQESSPSHVALRLSVDGWTGGRHRVYLVDETHHNPGAVYRDARRRGRGHAAALDAARAAAELRVTGEGPGVPDDVRLERHAVALVVLER